MKIMKSIFWKFLFLVLMVPPTAFSASSDSFPWSGDPNNNSNSRDSGVRRDAYGALRDNSMLPDTIPFMVQQNSMSPPTLGSAANQSSVETGVIAPGGTVTGGGSAAGNVGATQSGPGAAGLFTPNSPGNSAAYDAQVNGGLVGSPIVDGSGANLHITVPTATPSGIPNYHEVSQSDQDRITAGINRSHASISSHLRDFNTTEATTSRSADSLAPLNQQPATVRAANIPTIVNRHVARRSFSDWISPPHDSINSIGELRGSVTYADGQTTLFGTLGNAVIDSKRQIMILPNGEKVSMKTAEKAVRQVAQKNQVRL